MKKVLFSLTLLVAVFAISCSGRGDSAGHRRYDPMYGNAVSSSGVAGVSSPYSGRARLMTATPTAEMSFNDAAVIHDTLIAEESFSSEASNVNQDERKLIKRAYVSIRVENLETADVYVANLMNTYNSYSASTEADENSRRYSIRVPANLYDIFLDEMSGMGRLIRRSESTDDVTLRYYDLEGRLEMKRELLRTFQAYLTRARSIEEILSVEARIADLQYDIEGTAVQLRHLANRVDYATIDLYLMGPVSATQYGRETLGERILQLFGNFGGFLSTILLVIIGIIIFGIPSILILALLFWLLLGRIGLLRKLWGLIGKKNQ